MAGIFKNFVKLSIFAAVFPVLAFGTQTTTGRSATTRTANPDAVSSASVRRAATSVIARNAVKNGRKPSAVVSARPTTSRVASNRVTATRTVANTNATANVSRSATAKNATVGRSAKSNATARVATTKKSSANVSRAAHSRATAVFNDVSKIGGGYANCRDSYATCMDQFCANANDTYRRCYCSDRFVDFRKTADSLDQALNMLADFQNTNLDAVNKTAAEVNAMYTASEGEEAIKRDTSASQKMLDSIADILSGKKTYNKSSSSTPVSSSSTGVLDISSLFSSSSGDVFSGGGSVFDSGTNSLFSSSSGGYTNMSEMEGADLYESAARQCAAISKEACGSDAAFNLARSAYSILITQDCNLYEKNIDAKKESVQNTVRTAEKYLREARLEEYRAHNSADVNDCLTRVETAMRQPTACGENYDKCMDYTGMYINNATGEPIYSKALFDLNNLIVLNGTSDVLGANAKFDDFLESRKMFATTALDSCRGIADTVWYEFKRSALIQIAQAQDAKIQSVKDSCVETIANCYDKQTGDLKVLAGDDISKRTGAIAAVAARDACKDQVLACSALYGDPEGCKYDDVSKTITQVDGKKCGLESLLTYVNTVDTVRISQNCETSLRDYAQELCGDGTTESTSSATIGGYPWGCRNTTVDEIRKALKSRAKLYCGTDGDNKDDLGEDLKVAATDVFNIRVAIRKEIQRGMSDMMTAKCREYDGVWFDAGSSGNNVYGDVANSQSSSALKKFYADVYNNKEVTTWGRCVENTMMTRCLAQNDSDSDKVYTTYDESTMTCKFKDDWYKMKCSSIGGYYSGSKCYVPRSEYDSGYADRIQRELDKSNVSYNEENQR